MGCVVDRCRERVEVDGVALAAEETRRQARALEVAASEAPQARVVARRRMLDTARARAGRPLMDRPPAPGSWRGEHLRPVGTSLDASVRQYPVAELVWRDALERLGTRFIVRDGVQAGHLLTVMLERPTEAEVLRPYFAPSLAGPRFGDMFKQACAHGCLLWRCWKAYAYLIGPEGMVPLGPPCGASGP